MGAVDSVMLRGDVLSPAISFRTQDYRPKLSSIAPAFPEAPFLERMGLWEAQAGTHPLKTDSRP